MAASQFTQKYLDEADWHLWDSFVKNSGCGTVFQSSPYIRTVSQVFSRPVKILGVFRKNRLVGGTVLYPRKFNSRQYVTSPYFIPYNGFVLGNFEESSFYFNRIRLQNKVLDILLGEIESCYIFADFHLSPHQIDIRSLIWRNWQLVPDYTAIIDLQNDTDLFLKMDRDQRRRIRKFDNPDFKFQELENFQILYDLHEQSYRQHRITPVLSRNTFVNFVTELVSHKLGKCYSLVQADKVVTAVFVIEDSPNVFALFSGRRFDNEYSSAEVFLFWRIAHEYKSMGYSRFDLLGAMAPSIAKTKLELGGELQLSHHARFFRSKFYNMIYSMAVHYRKNRRNI